MPINIEDILSQVESELVSKLNRIDVLSLTDIQLQELFANIEILGYDKLINAIGSDAVSKVKQIISLAQEKGIKFNVGRIDQLSLLIDVNQNLARKASEYHLSKILSSTLLGVIAGEDTRTIINRIPQDIPFKTSWLVTEIDQNVNKFNQVVTAEVFSDSDNRFKLTGPLDGKTRCECKSVLFYQPKKGWTKKEIDEGKATEVVKKYCPKVKPESQEYTWLNRGGFGCRHDWALYSEELNGLVDQ